MDRFNATNVRGEVSSTMSRRLEKLQEAAFFPFLGQVGKSQPFRTENQSQILQQIHPVALVIMRKGCQFVEKMLSKRHVFGYAGVERVGQFASTAQPSENQSSRSGLFHRQVQKPVTSNLDGRYLVSKHHYLRSYYMIMNIESFNISKNVLYKLTNKINPVRFRAIAGGLALLSILALPGCSLLEPEKMPPKPANPTGVSGKHDPQAEQLFAKAHVLWKGETCTDPEKALEYLDEALKIEPDYPQALIRRGLALSQLGYADDAFDDLTKAIRLEPSAEAYLSRGICLLQQGNTAGARKDLEEALRRDDRSYRVWNILGAVSLKEGKEQEACEAFEKACSSGDCAGIEAARREKICK